MTQSTDELLDAALAYAEARWSVVPIAPRSKHPLLAWLEFQQRRALPRRSVAGSSAGPGPTWPW
jgi:hypothetical protein